MSDRMKRVETLVIGGGQAGLAVAYNLGQRGMPYVIVDANQRVGDGWRNRWDSLHLFTPVRFDSLPGMPFPGYRWAFPSKDEMADYLENYAKDYHIDVQTGVKVERLTRSEGGFLAETSDRVFEAENVVVAMSSWQQPKTPRFARDLEPGILQLHVADYRNPYQLQPGPVLVVGAGNSGAEIAKELSRTHDVWLSGRDTGNIPFRPESVLARLLMPFVGRVVFHRILTTDTPMGRRARPKKVASGEPLLRVKAKDLKEAGVERVPRVVDVEAGRPRLEDGRVLEARNVIWCTGFHPGFSWIDLPVIEDPTQQPPHRRGIVAEEPGLYFVGLKFLYSVSSEQIHGVGRDAEYAVDAIAARSRTVVAGRAKAAAST